MDNLEGKHFSITDPQGVNTVIYQINKTEKEFEQTSPKYTLERLQYTEEDRGDTRRKTFFVDEVTNTKDEIVILSFGKDKVVVNVGVLEENQVKISKKPFPMKCNTLYNEEETEYRNFVYTPNLKRPISIIDPDTGEEVKPVLYFDEDTNEVRGKCKLKPYKSYFAFELTDGKFKAAEIGKRIVEEENNNKG